MPGMVELTIESTLETQEVDVVNITGVEQQSQGSAEAVVSYSVAEEVAIKTPSIRRHQGPTCVVCMDRAPDVVLVPCGHQNLCSQCAHKWKDSRQTIGGGSCPTDRQLIERIIQHVPL